MNIGFFRFASKGRQAAPCQIKAIWVRPSWNRLNAKGKGKRGKTIGQGYGTFSIQTFKKWINGRHSFELINKLKQIHV